MFKNSIIFLPISVLVALVLFCCLFIPIIIDADISFETADIKTISLTNNFAWPAPGYKKITSPFGYRTAPTTGASTYHGGIDIAAPAGAKIVASFSGKVIYTDFMGAGGYTITIQNGSFTALYCHVSPNFVVSVGQIIKRGQTIGNVRSKECLWCAQ